MMVRMMESELVVLVDHCSILGDHLYSSSIAPRGRRMRLMVSYLYLIGLKDILTFRLMTVGRLLSLIGNGAWVGG